MEFFRGRSFRPTPPIQGACVGRVPPSYGVMLTGRPGGGWATRSKNAENMVISAKTPTWPATLLGVVQNRLPDEIIMNNHPKFEKSFFHFVELRDLVHTRRLTHKEHAPRKF